MRLEPIKSPSALLLKIAYFMSKRQFGKVLSPLLVIYSRSTPIFQVAIKILSADKKLSIGRDTNLLIRNYVSHLNDCKFCANAIEHMSVKENWDLNRLKDMFNFRNSPNYSDKEKAVLDYVEQISLTKTATQETFDKLKAFFNEKQIVEITWVCASENYFNMQAKPLGFTSNNLAFTKN
jgi:alkylhydroperoxidase family enzyme